LNKTQNDQRERFQRCNEDRKLCSFLQLYNIHRLFHWPDANRYIYDADAMKLVEVKALTVELPTPASWMWPVNEVSLRISKGESLGLVGESGSGKTMLSLALMGLLPSGARVNGEASLATVRSILV
jgi:ABC-type polysaccharide/polyol phosphate transport system ATPase subunit